MRKIYLTAIIAALCNVVMSQGFFVPTNYRGAFDPTQPQWTDTWTNWDPQNAVYPTATVTVSTSITVNTTWTANNTYLLSGQIYVKNGATLTIEPGTVILGDKASTGAGLFVTQGSKLMAEGTVNNPIIFSSNQAPGSRAIGDWGGVILLGRASNNNPGGIANIEGIAPIPDTQYGGGTNPDDADNSGSLKYVRIEFGGYVYAPNKEINGLTFGAVGSGTKIDFIQVSFSNDDAYEWFGGSVNCRHLVAYRNLDDEFDTDNGFHGQCQFLLSVRDPLIADNPAISTSEGFESDNDPTGDNALPQTTAIFSNVTFVGPLRGNPGATVAVGYRRGARIRRNSCLKAYNCVWIDDLRGIHIDGTSCEIDATNGTPLAAVSVSNGVNPNPTFGVIKYKNNLIAGYQPGKSTEVNAGSTFDAKTWFGANSNDSLASSAGILVNPYGDGSDFMTNLDFRPAVSSPALSNYSYIDSAFAPVVLFAPTATTNVSYCVGATATALSATAHNGNTLAWYTVATGGTPLTNIPTPSTAAAGTFTYYVAQVGVQNIEGPRTAITVTVHSNPTAPVVTPSGSTSFCTGSTITLTSSQTTGIVWNNTNNSTTASIVVGTTGDYTVNYTDNNGCTATSLPLSVNVSSTPIPTVTASGPLSFCQGDSVVLTSSAGDTYSWSNSATTASITVHTAGTYHVTTTNADACQGVGQSANIVVTVNPNPTAHGAFTSSGDVVTFSSTGSTGATSYSWDFGDGNNSSQANPVHAYVGNGSYDVVVTASNGNCTDTFALTVVISVGLEEMSTFEHVGLYPNPVKEEATLLLQMNDNATVDVVVYDMSGKIVANVYNGAINAGSTELKINTTDLSNGLYYTRISTGNSVKTIKMTVSK